MRLAVVSSDGENVDLHLGKGKSLVKVVAWYDNEYSYTCQMCRVVKYICKKFL